MIKTEWKTSCLYYTQAKKLPERYEGWIEATAKRLEGLLGRFAEVDDGVSGDQVGSVGPLV